MAPVIIHIVPRLVNLGASPLLAGLIGEVYSCTFNIRTVKVNSVCG